MSLGGSWDNNQPHCPRCGRCPNCGHTPVPNTRPYYPWGVPTYPIYVGDFPPHVGTAPPNTIVTYC